MKARPCEVFNVFVFAAKSTEPAMNRATDSESIDECDSGCGITYNVNELKEYSLS